MTVCRVGVSRKPNLQPQSCTLSCACPHLSSVSFASSAGSLSTTWESLDSLWSNPWPWELCSPQKPSLPKWEHHICTMLGRVSYQWTCGKWCCSNALLNEATLPMFSAVHLHSSSNILQPTCWKSRSAHLFEGDRWCWDSTLSLPTETTLSRNSLWIDCPDHWWCSSVTHEVWRPPWRIS